MALTLTLRAVPQEQLNASAPARIGDRRSVTQGNLSIGRGPINDWVLPDPLLSKTHCAVSLLDGRYVLTDLSTNGVFVNGSRQRMSKDSRIVLTDGDSFALGGYIIEVEEPMAERPAAFPDGETVAPFARGRSGEGDPFAPGPGGAPSYLDRGEDDPLQTVPPHMRSPGEAPARDPFQANAPQGFGAPRAPVVSSTPRGLDPFDLLDEPSGHVPDPEADQYKGRDADPSWKGTAQRDDVDAHQGSFQAPKAMWSGRLDDQSIDDLLGDDLPGAPPTPHAPPPQQRAAPPVSPGASPFDDLLGDDDFGAPPAPPPRTAPPVAPPPPPRTAPPVPFDDILGDDDFGAPPAAPPRTAPPAVPPPVTPPPRGAASPFDEPAAEPPPSRPPPRATVAGGGDDARLLAAFLAGAGASQIDVSQQDPEAYMRAVGELMRMMIERLREVLMSRAEVKRELGVDQTMLRSRNNNALKFSVTPEDAVAALLQPNRPGYLPPMQAAREALDDIGSHQVAVMAGVQTALFDLLKRFDPVALEKRLTGGSIFDNIMPSARKARIWELFCATYKDIANEAQEDFTSLFGREFARGYNEQVKKQ